MAAFTNSDSISKLARELEAIVGADEFASIDFYQAFLPSSERERINAEAKREEDEWQKSEHGGLVIGVESRQLEKIEDTFWSAYETIRRRAWTGIKDLCGEAIESASEKLVETESLKEAFARAFVAQSASDRAMAFASEVATLPSGISVSRVHELLKRMVDPRHSLWSLSYKAQDYHRLRGLALIVSVGLSEAVWGDKRVEINGPSYYPIFGLQCGMRIKVACRRLQPYKIFPILGPDFFRLASWFGQFPEEDKRRFEALYGHLLRAGIWNEIRLIGTDWRALRQLALNLERRQVVSYARHLLGGDKASQLGDWINRAKNVPVPDCSPETIKELLEDIESLRDRPVDPHRFIDEVLKNLGMGAPDDYTGSLYAMNYYAAILVQELVEQEIDSSEEGWKTWELRWKLSSLRLLM